MQKQLSILFITCLIICLSDAEIKGQNIVKKLDTMKARHSICCDDPEEYPQFLGGTTDNFLNDNLMYPDSAYCYCFEGTAMIEISISAEGKVISIRPLNIVPYGCTAEALRVIGLMKCWKAGKIHDKPVDSKMIISIRFSPNYWQKHK